MIMILVCSYFSLREILTAIKFIPTCLIFSPIMEWFKFKWEKNQDLLVVDKYLHRIDRIRGDNEYYKCVDNCGGAVQY